jgi:hypothetical protein
MIGESRVLPWVDTCLFIRFSRRVRRIVLKHTYPTFELGERYSAEAHISYILGERYSAEAHISYILGERYSAEAHISYILGERYSAEN